MSHSPPQHGDHHYSIDRKNSYQSDFILTSSTSSTSSSPLTQSVSSTASEMRETLYHCPSGKRYIATRTVQPQQDGDLLLEKGMQVEGQIIMETADGHSNSYFLYLPHTFGYLKNPINDTFDKFQFLIPNLIFGMWAISRFFLLLNKTWSANTTSCLLELEPQRHVSS